MSDSLPHSQAYDFRYPAKPQSVGKCAGGCHEQIYDNQPRLSLDWAGKVCGRMECIENVRTKFQENIDRMDTMMQALHGSK